MSYKEYPIRCPTCNEPLAHKSIEYENLINNGIDIEDALNSLDIMNICSRGFMLTPTIRFSEFENRQEIEKTAIVKPNDSIDFIACSKNTLVNTDKNIDGISTIVNKIKPALLKETKLYDIKGDRDKTEIDFTEERYILNTRVDEEEEGGFAIPTVVGIPTINHDPTIEEENKFVGSGYYVKVLNGRTYLAR